MRACAHTHTHTATATILYIDIENYDQISEVLYTSIACSKSVPMSHTINVLNKFSSFHLLDDEQINELRKKAPSKIQSQQTNML